MIRAVMYRESQVLIDVDQYMDHWTAFEDDYDRGRPCGSGGDMQSAIADLLEQLEERDHGND